MPTPGQFEQLRRVDRAGGKDHFTTRFGDIVDTGATIFDSGAAAAVEHDTLRVGTSNNCEVLPLQRGPQKRLRRIPANAALLVDVEVADAGVVAAIEIVGGGNAGLLRGLCELFQNLPFEALLLDAPGSARAVRFVGAAVVILAAPEDRQHRVP
ncbi:hypothetical protein QFZ98_008320 [Paraburkholderia youngii]